MSTQAIHGDPSSLLDDFDEVPVARLDRDVAQGSASAAAKIVLRGNADHA